MVYTYRQVQKLAQKHAQDKEIAKEELQKLEEYVENKKQVAELARGKWSKKQLANAELLLHKIKSSNTSSIKVNK